MINIKYLHDKAPLMLSLLDGLKLPQLKNAGITGDLSKLININHFPDGDFGLVGEAINIDIPEDFKKKVSEKEHAHIVSYVEAHEKDEEVIFEYDIISVPIPVAGTESEEAMNWLLETLTNLFDCLNLLTNGKGTYFYMEIKDRILFGYKRVLLCPDKQVNRKALLKIMDENARHVRGAVYAIAEMVKTENPDTVWPVYQKAFECNDLEEYEEVCLPVIDFGKTGNTKQPKTEMLS